MKLAWASLLLFAAAGGAAAQEGPAPTSFVFEEVATLAPAQVLGETPTGRRQAIPITGGSFSGPGIKGRILPGGADYQLVRSDGSSPSTMFSGERIRATGPRQRTSTAKRRASGVSVSSRLLRAYASAAVG